MISENLTAQNSTFLTSAKYERLLYYTKFWYCFEINLVQYLKSLNILKIFGLNRFLIIYNFPKLIFPLQSYSLGRPLDEQDSLIASKWTTGKSDSM